MNITGKHKDIRAISVPPKLYIVRDKHGNPWGPFGSGIAADKWALEKWPDQEQDEDGEGTGWDVESLWPPNR